MVGSIVILLGAVGSAAIALALVVTGLLSQRLGAVTKMPPYYRWFYLAAALVGVSTVARLLAMNGGDDVLATVYAGSLALGVTLGVVVAWRYWSWLFGERNT